MARANRGEIWQVDLGVPLGSEQGFERPCLVLSSTMLQLGGVVIVAPISSNDRALVVRVPVEPSSDNGLSVSCAVQLDHVRSISTRRLVRRRGTLDTYDMLRVEAVLKRVLDL